MTNGTRRTWGVSVTPRPLFTPGKDPVPIVQETGWARGPVWTDAENLAPTGIGFPGRPARSQSLHIYPFYFETCCSFLSLLYGRNMFNVFEKFTLLFTNKMNASWLLLNMIWWGKMFPRAILTTCLWSALIIFRLMIIKRVWSSQHHIPLIPCIPLLVPLCSTSEAAFLFRFNAVWC